MLDMFCVGIFLKTDDCEVGIMLRVCAGPPYSLVNTVL